MPFYVKKRITHEEAKSLPVGAVYFKVYLMDEDANEIAEFVGRYRTMSEAKSACRSYAQEELDGESGNFEIQIFRINEKGHPRVAEIQIY